MSDDLDDLLRRAMKSLDDQVPSGYFEDLANETLRRLEDDSSMQTDDRQLRAPGSPSGSGSMSASSSGSSSSGSQGGGTSKPAARDEDSGLHDIRSLASSQRMRISSKRSSQSSIVPDEELLSSTSGSWKAVALPEPAKMISLPALAELPAANDVLDLEKARAAEKARISRSKLDAKEAKAAVEASTAAALEAKAAATASAVEAAPAAKPVAAKPAAAAPKPSAAPAKRSKTPLIAGVGIAAVAAAGAAAYVATQKDAAGPQVAAATERAPVRDNQLPALNQPAARTPEPPPAPAPAVTAIEEKPADPTPAPEPDKKAAAAPAKPAAAAAKGAGRMVPNVVEEPKETEKKVEAAPEKKKDPNDPDFNSLLKEAGYQEKKDTGPKLDKKSLSGEDIKKGMAGVGGAVQACYAGQQGTAAVRLTVGPNGQVQKVAVSGAFAGTPVGACVEAAVRSASFPPWDGGPQSINYSYLLSE